MKAPMHTKGYFYAAITIILWSGWAVVTRLGTTHDLTPLDIAFIRFMSAGLIMLPIAIKNLHLITRENRKSIAIMLCGAGIVYFMFMSFGFKNAPASHSIITPCFMPVLVALISARVFKERFTRARIFGYSVIVCGVAFKISTSFGSGLLYADMLFVMGALSWSIYTINAKKQKNLSPIVITAFVQTGSMVLIIIPYIIYQYLQPHSLPAQGIAVQAIYQGLITSVISLLTYNKALEIIGASKTSSFAAMLPLLVIIFSIPILGEYPTSVDIIFAALMTIGVFFASGVIKRKARAMPVTEVPH